MSWQAYVDDQLISKNLKKAAIAGLDGNIWAKSADFNLTSDEVKNLLSGYDDSSKLYSAGLVLVKRGKQGKGGVHIMKTKQTLLVSIYDEPLTAPEAANITESLGEYLNTCGY